MKMKLLILASLLIAVRSITYQYTIRVSTKDVEHANSDGWFYASALGYNGNMIDFGLMDNPE